jgi:hypothetical protein
VLESGLTRSSKLTCAVRVFGKVFGNGFRNPGKCKTFFGAATVSPSSMRGWNQSPLAKAACVQISQLSLRHPPLGSGRRGDKHAHESCQPLFVQDSLNL